MLVRLTKSSLTQVNGLNTTSSANSGSSEVFKSRRRQKLKPGIIAPIVVALALKKLILASLQTLIALSIKC